MRWPKKAKLVRLHFADGSTTIDGVYLGVAAGHYRIAKPSVLDAEDVGVSIDGEAWVPRERILFMQVLS